MPIYEYACEKCGTKIDVLQKMDDPAPAECEQCHEKGTMARQVSRTSFVLKGGGWYSDLYGSSKKDASATTVSPASPPSTDKASTTAKPADTAPKKDSGGSGSSGGSTPSSGGTPSPGGSGPSGSSASAA